MSQSEILEVLKRFDKPLSVSEISDKARCNKQVVFVEIKTMLRYKEVDFIEIGREEAMKNHGCKRRMRLYFIRRENGNQRE